MRIAGHSGSVACQRCRQPPKRRFATPATVCAPNVRRPNRHMDMSGSLSRPVSDTPVPDALRDGYRYAIDTLASRPSEAPSFETAIETARSLRAGH